MHHNITENDVCICDSHCEYLTIPDAFSLPLFNSHIGILYAAIRSKHQLDGQWIQPITSLHVQQAHLSPPGQVTDPLYCPPEVRLRVMCLLTKKTTQTAFFFIHNLRICSIFFLQYYFWYRSVLGPTCVCFKTDIARQPDNVDNDRKLATALNSCIHWIINAYFLSPISFWTAGCERESSVSMWIYVFLGNVLRGIGETPVQPLGISYIDDYAQSENAALYIGYTPHSRAMFVALHGTQTKVTSFSL